jgi:translin
MQNLESVLQEIDNRMEEKNAIREQTLNESRHLVQYASKIIRAIHRHEWEEARTLLAEAGSLMAAMNDRTLSSPDIYWAGYVQDAQKEFAEAHLTLALVRNESLPSPTELHVEDASYLNGLAEAASELRRYILDLVRHGELEESDRLLEAMEEVYGHLIAIDYPHAITNNLRRTTDSLRGVLERTRGDVTTAMKQKELQDALRALETRLQ